MINYILEHFPLLVMCAILALQKALKSCFSNLIIEVVKELLVGFITELIKKHFKKKGD